jgi:hypothetical protein
MRTGRKLALIWAIIFALKLLYVFLFGLRIEIDSFNYVFNTLSFEYPLLYPSFLHFAHIIYPGLGLIPVLQSFIFACCAAAFIHYVSTNRKQAFLFAILLGLDPVSGFFCTDIMSESLFISILFCWIILIYHFFRNKEYSKIHVFIIGCVGALLYLDRFAGIIFVLAFLVISVIFTIHRKRVLLTILITVIGFQLTLLPVRIKYKEVFGTFRINGFTGAMLWNNASVIYPNSAIQKKPRTSFEKLLSQCDINAFNEYNALKARQLNEPSLPFRLFISKQKYKPQDAPKVSDEAGSAALRLISTQPWQYFRRYVIPNAAQFFFDGEYTVNATAYCRNFGDDYLPEHYRPIVPYTRLEWSAVFISLLFSAWLYLKGRRPLIAGIVILVSCCYLFILPFVCTVAIRLELIIFPITLSALFLQLTDSTIRRSV